MIGAVRSSQGLIIRDELTTRGNTIENTFDYRTFITNFKDINSCLYEASEKTVDQLSVIKNNA